MNFSNQLEGPELPFPSFANADKDKDDSLNQMKIPNPPVVPKAYWNVTEQTTPRTVYPTLQPSQFAPKPQGQITRSSDDQDQ